MVGSSVAGTLDLAPARHVLDEKAPIGRGHVVPLLQVIQGTYGYVPEEVLVEVRAGTGIPLSHLYGVATFDAQFYLKPHARHTVRERGDPP